MGGIHALVPVKGLVNAKSRLSPRFTDTERRDLVLAMLTDTVRAAIAAESIERVTVVTGDPIVADAVRALGCEVLREPARTRSLNEALRWAIGQVDPNARLLILQADLPALTAAELSAFTASAPQTDRVFANDQHHTGTTALLLRSASTPFEPQFGVDSALRHRDAGVRLVDGEWPGLRHDVDTADDLDVAVSIGVGPATRAALALASAAGERS
ncbi:MAG: 2-phospho-L-lactate guanylyltransferase [Nocardiaceae bacterium]|nr:2-phospho-L-lactate guanylyltransferase [Nocardiaceae bacterium]